ncbi:MAG: polyprenyl synthetase family protein [Spirochaetota bacterium]
MEMRDSLFTGFSDIDECAKYVVDTGGKRIRASLVILSSGLPGEIPSKIEHLAAGVELTHSATLLHDDVIDNARVRRGKPTVSEKWDTRSAILLGDLMFATALDVAIELDRKDLYLPMADAAKGMVKGEFLQNRYSDINSISPDIYFEIIALKTGGFMGACSYLGGAFVCMDDDKTSRLRLFGQELGISFQIIDDILDYISGEPFTGKDEGNDFLNGKVTLPVLLSLEKMNSAARREISACFSSPTPEGWRKVKDAALSTGAVDRSIRLAEEHISRATDRLSVFEDTSFRNILLDLSRFIVERVY